MSNRFIEKALDDAFSSTLGRDNLGTIIMLIAIVSLGVLYAIVRYSAYYVDIPPLTFVGARFICSATIMLLFNFSIRYLEGPSEDERPNAQFWFDFFVWGSLVGFFLLSFTIVIQYSEESQTAGQTSFIVGMYVVVIPFIEWGLSFFTLKFSWLSMLAIAIDVPGIILLSGCTEYDCFSGAAWGVGLNLIAMLCVSIHTILSARGVTVVGVRILLVGSCIFCALAGTILALIFETEQWVYPYPAISQYWYLIITSAIAETLVGVCITLSLAFLSTSRAAIVMSIESVSGAVFGFIILGETMNGLEYLGAALMLTAVAVELAPSCFSQGEKKDEEGVDLAPTESSPLLDVHELRR